MLGSTIRSAAFTCLLLAALAAFSYGQVGAGGVSSSPTTSTFLDSTGEISPLGAPAGAGASGILSSETDTVGAPSADYDYNLDDASVGTYNPALRPSYGIGPRGAYNPEFLPSYGIGGDAVFNPARRYQYGVGGPEFYRSDLWGRDVYDYNFDDPDFGANGRPFRDLDELVSEYSYAEDRWIEKRYSERNRRSRLNY